MSAELPHTMLASALCVRAAEYVAGLGPGATVTDYDRAYLIELGCWKYIDEELAEQNLMLDGDTVVPLLRMAAE